MSDGVDQGIGGGTDRDRGEQQAKAEATTIRPAHSLSRALELTCSLHDMVRSKPGIGHRVTRGLQDRESTSSAALLTGPPKGGQSLLVGIGLPGLVGIGLPDPPPIGCRVTNRFRYDGFFPPSGSADILDDLQSASFGPYARLARWRQERWGFAPYRMSSPRVVRTVRSGTTARSITFAASSASKAPCSSGSTPL